MAHTIPPYLFAVRRRFILESSPSSLLKPRATDIPCLLFPRLLSSARNIKLGQPLNASFHTNMDLMIIFINKVLITNREYLPFRVTVNTFKLDRSLLTKSRCFCRCWPLQYTRYFRTNFLFGALVENMPKLRPFCFVTSPRSILRNPIHCFPFITTPH